MSTYIWQAYAAGTVELRHLRYFCVVAETLNISEASRRLRVAQPSLSRQVRDLEHEIGHPLFRRIKGRISLTDTGIALRSHAARIVADADATLAHFRNIAVAATTELRVGYFATTWATILSPALPRFRRHFPEVVLRGFELSPAQIVAELKQGALDLGVLPPGGVKRDSDLVVTPIGSVQALVAMSIEHRLAKRRVVDLAEIRNETFLSYQSATFPRRDRPLIEACLVMGFKPRLLREASGLPALLLSVAQNRGIALVSSFAQEVSHPGVVFSRIKPPGVSFDLFIGHRVDAPVAAQRLAELIATESRRSFSV